MISQRRPAARNCDLRSISTPLLKFTFPAIQSKDFRNINREFGLAMLTIVPGTRR